MTPEQIMLIQMVVVVVVSISIVGWLLSIGKKLISTILSIITITYIVIVYGRPIHGFFFG